MLLTVVEKEMLHNLRENTTKNLIIEQPQC